MTSHTYMILIRDGSLALAVGAALEDRLVQDGHDALALIPAIRGLEFADVGYDRHLGTWQGAPGHSSRPPQVVALYEDGLLKRLESLGLAAYVGVPQEEEWRIVHWDNDAGAMLLPVATARDLVEAVADHTPWSQYAAEASKVALLHRRDGRTESFGGPPALSRKLAVASAAGVAGSMLLVGVPTTAVASSSAVQAPSQTSATSNGTMVAVDTAFQPSQAPSSVSGALSQATTGIQNFFGQVGAAIQRSFEIQGQIELTNAQANLAFGNAVIAAAPYFDQGFKSGAETGLLYGTAGGAIIGTIGGAIAGGPAGAAAGFKAGTEVGFGAGVTIGGLIGGINGFINAPVWSTPTPATVTLSPVPQVPSALPQGFRNEFGLGPNGSALGATTPPPGIPQGFHSQFGLGPNGSPLGATTAPAPQGTRNPFGQPPGSPPAPAPGTTGQGGGAPGGAAPPQGTTTPGSDGSGSTTPPQGTTGQDTAGAGTTGQGSTPGGTAPGAPPQGTTTAPAAAAPPAPAAAPPPAPAAASSQGTTTAPAVAPAAPPTASQGTTIPTITPPAPPIVSVDTTTPTITVPVIPTSSLNTVTSSLNSTTTAGLGSTTGLGDSGISMSTGGTGSG